MPTKNLRQGRIDIEDGSSSALTKTAAFTEGDFTYTVTSNVIQVKNRGALDHLRKGDEEAITFSFSAKFVDKTLQRCLEEFIFDAQTKNLTGLTANALNSNVALDYAYEQGSLAVASTESGFSKLAAGATPSSSGEFAEETATRTDLKGVSMVGDAEVVAATTPGEFAVFMPAADTDLDVVYDAIGRSTFQPGASDIKTLTIKLVKLKPELITQANETYTLSRCYLESYEQAEGDEYDVVSFNGVAYIQRPSVA